MTRSESDFREERRIAEERNEQIKAEFTGKRDRYTKLGATSTAAGVGIAILPLFGLASASPLVMGAGLLLIILGAIWITVSIDLNGAVHDVKSHPMRYLTLDLSAFDGGDRRGKTTPSGSSESGHPTS